MLVLGMHHTGVLKYIYEQVFCGTWVSWQTGKSSFEGTVGLAEGWDKREVTAEGRVSLLANMRVPVALGGFGHL